MKRFLKLTALVLAVAMLAVSLCSCQYLEDLKANRAFYTDSTKRALTYHDNVYKMLSPGEKLGFIFDFKNGDSQYVTEQDVPALLSGQFGDWYMVDEDGVLISVNEDYYVREDRYDEMKSVVENAALDHYYLSYYFYPEEDYNASYQRNILLDDDMTNIINRTLNMPAKDKVSYDELDEVDSYNTKVIYLYHCDKDMLVSDFTSVYLIRDYSKKYYLWDGNSYNETSFCPVAEADTDAFEALFNKYPDAVDWEDFSWYFEDRYDTYDEPDVSDYYYEYESTRTLIDKV